MNTSPGSYQFLRELVHRRAAIVVESGKEYLFESRLVPLAKQEGFESIDALVARLRCVPESVLTTRVLDAMTTNETSFFRDIHPFETLRTELLPRLIESRRASRSLRIWCAAASTGQEPYSIALTIREHFPELASWNVSILATDLNQSVLDRAARGTYKQLEINRGMPAPMLVKHFEKDGLDWRLKPDVRALVKFQQLNLLHQWPIFGALDIVFLRNVLIYFDIATKKEILRRVRAHLGPDSALILGGAETTMNVDDAFESFRMKNSVFYRLKQTESERKVANGSR